MSSASIGVRASHPRNIAPPTIPPNTKNVTWLFDFDVPQQFPNVTYLYSGMYPYPYVKPNGWVANAPQSLSPSVSLVSVGDWVNDWKVPFVLYVYVVVNGGRNPILYTNQTPDPRLTTNSLGTSEGLITINFGSGLQPLTTEFRLQLISNRITTWPAVNQIAYIGMRYL